MSSLFGPLSPDEHRVEERLRTLALCICALGVMGAALNFLRSVLVPFVLAVALKQMLAPVVNRLDQTRLGCGLRLPRLVAVLLTLSFATALIVIGSLILADSVRQFSAHASEYSQQVQRLLSSLFSLMDKQGINSSVRLEKLKKLGEQLPLTSIILNVIESLLVTVSDLALVLLFAIYLLLGTVSTHGPRDRVSQTVDAHITSFIKGKVLLSLLTGVCTGIILRCGGRTRLPLSLFRTRRRASHGGASAIRAAGSWGGPRPTGRARPICARPLEPRRHRCLNVDLWLVFGVLAFWLNFIPNVGALIAVLLPLPLVLFNPTMGPAGMLMAVLLPLLLHAFVGNVLEPIMFGSSLELHPVIVLLSLMLWSALWGVTGLVLAVPLTAVMRIHLSHIDHPLPRLILRILDGGAAAAAERSRSSSWHPDSIDGAHDPEECKGLTKEEASD